MKVAVRDSTSVGLGESGGVQGQVAVSFVTDRAVRHLVTVTSVPFR